MQVADQRGWYSITVGILRQELDSTVRVIFLLSQCDHRLRTQLLEQAVCGEAWTVPTPNGKLKKVRDREMVDLAQGLHGWTQLVYRFGCSFIHLSDLHDYQARDPFNLLRFEDGPRAITLRGPFGVNKTDAKHLASAEALRVAEGSIGREEHELGRYLLRKQIAEVDTLDPQRSVLRGWFGVFHIASR